MKRNRNSLVGALMHAIITIRMVILIFLAVLVFFVRFPPTFLAILVLALLYSVYRIVKDWRASRLAKRPNKRAVS